MSEVNLQISVSHLTQIDRLQNDTHRLPMVHQLQNAEAVDDAMNRRVAMPVEPDGIEKKNIDHEEKKNNRERRQKKERHPSASGTGQHADPGGGTSFIDVTV